LFLLLMAVIWVVDKGPPLHFYRKCCTFPAEVKGEADGRRSY
jgi:hypothetical protein